MPADSVTGVNAIYLQVTEGAHKLKVRIEELLEENARELNDWKKKCSKMESNLQNLTNDVKKERTDKEEAIHKFKEVDQHRKDSLKQHQDAYSKLQTEKNSLEVAYNKEVCNNQQLQQQCQLKDESNQRLHDQHQALLRNYSSSEKERATLAMRLGMMPGAKLTTANANIADLSDENRPTKVAEKFSELYDNEWTDAFEYISERFNNEEERGVTYMLNMLQTNGSEYEHRLQCQICGTFNDSDFKFCKICGSLRRSQDSKSSQLSVSADNLIAINKRISQLDSIVDSSSYTKQKNKLKDQMSEFFEAISPTLNIYNATPEDIRKFLVFKEPDGRTQLHVNTCLFRGTPSKQCCECPVTMAAKSVDSLIGKIRALFRDMGRSGEWNPMLSTGNPASSIIFKRHLKAITNEQISCNVVTKQAVPLMFDKLGALCRHLTYQISVEENKLTKFLLLRDRAYFSLICHSGDRASDLGLLMCERLYQMPNEQGIFISQIAGKTISLDNPKNFIILKSRDTSICPINHLTSYVHFASVINVDLTTGYLFRPKDCSGRTISNKPVTSSTMSERLKSHLIAINMYAGESAHSSRRGCAITLRMLGLSDESINKHIGWGSERMLDHYAGMGNLCAPRSVAATLSKAAAESDDYNRYSVLEQISKQYRELGQLPKLFDTKVDH